MGGLCRKETMIIYSTYQLAGTECLNSTYYIKKFSYFLITVCTFIMHLSIWSFSSPCPSQSHTKDSDQGHLHEHPQDSDRLCMELIYTLKMVVETLYLGYWKLLGGRGVAGNMILTMKWVIRVGILTIKVTLCQNPLVFPLGLHINRSIKTNL